MEMCQWNSERVLQARNAHFGTFEDISREYKANPSPDFHNAMAQAVQDIKIPAWVSALEQWLLDLVRVQYSHKQLINQPQQKRSTSSYYLSSGDNMRGFSLQS
jgi:hypothetical protein